MKGVGCMGCLTFQLHARAGTWVWLGTACQTRLSHRSPTSRRRPSLPLALPDFPRSSPSDTPSSTQPPDVSQTAPCHDPPVVWVEFKSSKKNSWWVGLAGWFRVTQYSELSRPISLHSSCRLQRRSARLPRHSNPARVRSTRARALGVQGFRVNI